MMQVFYRNTCSFAHLVKGVKLYNKKLFLILPKIGFWCLNYALAEPYNWAKHKQTFWVKRQTFYIQVSLQDLVMFF